MLQFHYIIHFSTLPLLKSKSYYIFLPVRWHFLLVSCHFLPVRRHFLLVRCLRLLVRWHFLPARCHFLPDRCHFLPARWLRSPVRCFRLHVRWLRLHVRCFRSPVRWLRLHVRWGLYNRPLPLPVRFCSSRLAPSETCPAYAGGRGLGRGFW